MRLRHHPIPQECPAGGGEGAGWGRPALSIPVPSSQRAAASAPCLGRGFPSPEMGSPLRYWGRQPGLWAPRPLGVQGVTFCHLLCCCWAGKWVIRVETGAYPAGQGCSEVMLLLHRLSAGGFALGRRGGGGVPPSSGPCQFLRQRLSPHPRCSVHTPRLMIPAAALASLLP